VAAEAIDEADAEEKVGTLWLWIEKEQGTSNL